MTSGVELPLAIKALPTQPRTKHLLVGTLDSHPSVGVLCLARPDKLNAFGTEMWDHFAQAVQLLEAAEDVRCILLVGQGAHFCAGIDTAYLQHMMGSLARQHSCPARMREAFRANLFKLQEAYSCLERCKWPVIAAVHGCCVGGAVDLVTACDLRVCSQDATFCVKEADLAITADLGTLQRLPSIIGHGAAIDLALTCRTVSSQEALRLGLVTQVLGQNQAELLAAAQQLAAAVAAKSPLALIGTKRVLLHTRDTPGVAGNLEYVATYNAAMLFSEDLQAAMTARKGSPPRFSKL